MEIKFSIGYNLKIFKKSEGVTPRGRKGVKMSTRENGRHLPGVGPIDPGVVSYERACSELSFDVKIICLGQNPERGEKRESVVYIQLSVADAR